MMTKYEFIQEVSQGLTKISFHQPWTDFEKSQLASNLGVIQLSKGHLIFPFLSREEKVAIKREVYEERVKTKKCSFPKRWSFFQMQVCLLVVLNKNPYGRNISDRELVNGCANLYFRDYIGNYNFVKEDFLNVSGELKKNLILLKKMGYNGFVSYAKEIYPSCFVGDDPRFKHVKGEIEEGVRKCDISRKARTDKKIDLIVKFLSKIKGKKVKTYMSFGGKFKKKVMTEINKIVSNFGFKKLKKTALYEYVKRALDILGITREDIWSKGFCYDASMSDNACLLFSLVSKTENYMHDTCMDAKEYPYLFRQDYS